jgi:putative ABC transport system substrate-binding protein
LAAPRIDAIVSGLRASGYALPQVEVVARSAEGDPSRVVPLVADVIAKNVSLFVANGPAALQAARAATRTLPILAIDFESDPVASNFAASLARPGGNVTGVFLDFPNFTAKWIELLVECTPKLSRIAVLWDPTTGPVQVEAVTKAATTLRIQTDLLEVRVRAELADAFSVASQRGAGAVIALSSPLFGAGLRDLAELALQHHLPSITLFPDFARAGGLFAYGPNLLGTYRQVGVLAGKVLAGTAPANLPIERPTKFELIVNLRTAQALGLSIPTSIQVRADEVIE